MKRFIAFVLVLAMALVAFASCGETASKTTTPAAKTTAPVTAPASEPTAEQTAEPTAPATEPAGPTLFEKLKEGFTATIEVKDASGAILPVSVVAKIAADLTDTFATADVKILDAEGNEALNVFAGLTKTALVASSNLFGEQVFGVDFTTLEADFASSVFAPTSGSKYALDAETFAQLAALLGNLANGTDMTQAAKAKAEEYVNALKLAFAPFIKAEKVEGVDAYVISITNENIADIVDALYAKVASDAELSALLGEVSAIAEDFDISEIANSIRATAFTVSGTVSVAAGTVTVKTEEADYILDYAMNAGSLTARVYAKVGEIEADIFTLNVITAGDKTTAVASFTGEGMTASATATIEGGAYTLDVEVTGAAAMKLSLAGKLEMTDEYFLFTVESVKLSQQGMDISLALLVSVKVEAAYEITIPEEYQNVLKMSEEQVDALAQVIGSLIGAGIEE